MIWGWRPRTLWPDDERAGMSQERIDSHQHFWRYSPAEHAWIDEPLAALRRDFLPRDLEPELRSAGIGGCIAVQAAQTLAENRFLLDWEQAVADTRLHGTTRRQVGTHFSAVERAALQRLPAERFPCFRESRRTGPRASPPAVGSRRGAPVGGLRGYAGSRL